MRTGMCGQFGASTNMIPIPGMRRCEFMGAIANVSECNGRPWLPVVFLFGGVKCWLCVPESINILETEYKSGTPLDHFIIFLEPS
jgi:hypothetical protein